jgi:ATP-dependent Clp protease protease subunit
MLFLQQQDPQRPITLRVESPGGSLAAGLAIVDTVRFLESPVRTEAPTLAHGVAAVILASGRKGDRVVGPAAELSLLPVESADPTADTRRARRHLAEIIAGLCDQSTRAVEELLLVGRSFTPDEAIAYGLADRIAV